MTKLLVAAVAVSAIAALNLAPQPAQARHCSLVTATAPGVFQGIATTRAQWRLQRYVTLNLSGWPSLLALVTPARVGALQAQASAQLVKARL